MDTTVADGVACTQCAFNHDGCPGGKVACATCGELSLRCHVNQDGICEWCPNTGGGE